MVKRVFVALSRGVFNLLYRLFCLGGRRDEVLFFSRQTNQPSFDFRALGDQFQCRGWSVTYLTKKLSKRSIAAYCPFIVRELYHLARCRICFVDRYDPVICLLDLECETEPAARRENGQFLEYPIEPVVIQLWHAFGAFKKFGFQSTDNPEGHSLATAELFCIHRNYSWVICSGERARPAFAEAFRVPEKRVVPLLRPEYDRLQRIAEERLLRKEGGKDAKPRILFAPTLRKSSASAHPFRRLYDQGKWRRLESLATVQWAFHPLEQTGRAATDVNELLVGADLLVTDYSSIVYEARLLSIPALFFVPDVEDYRIAPGLNLDPAQLCPSLTFTEEEELFACLEAFARDPEHFDFSELASFMEGAFAQTSPEGAPSAIVSFSLGVLPAESRA